MARKTPTRLRFARPRKPTVFSNPTPQPNHPSKGATSTPFFSIFVSCTSNCWVIKSDSLCAFWTLSASIRTSSEYPSSKRARRDPQPLQETEPLRAPLLSHHQHPLLPPQQLFLKQCIKINPFSRFTVLQVPQVFPPGHGTYRNHATVFQELLAVDWHGSKLTPRAR